MTLNESLEKIREIWRKECLELVEPVSAEDTIKKLKNLKMPIAQDVIKVYSTLGGMADGESDATLFSFWDIDKISEENTADSELMSFADFLIYSHLYYFKFENESVSSIHIYWSENDVRKLQIHLKNFLKII